jgi:hypothetical protein
MTFPSEVSAFDKSRSDFDSVEFMRSRHPDLYSDSTPILQPQLSKELTQAVFEHDRVSLAVEALGIEEVSLRSERRTGPRDFKRQQELQELDAEIANPDRYAGARYQLAEDCLRAALLPADLRNPAQRLRAIFRERIALLQK